MSNVKYLSAREWAKLAAYSWYVPEFQDEFELDPVSAINEWQSKTDSDGHDIPKLSLEQFDRLIRIPENPGFSRQDLIDALCQDSAIVPITSFAIHGVSEK